MKKISTIFILFLVIILTGCSGTYTININDDLSVKEEVSLTVKKTSESNDKLEKIFQQYDLSEKDYSIKDSEDKLKVTYKKDYASMEDYFVNSKLYNQLFNDVNYSNDGSSITIDTNSKLMLNSEKAFENINNNFYIKLLNIDINTPLDLEYSNSDSYENNTMRWVLDENTTEKRINFTLLLKNNETPRGYLFLFVFLIAVVVGVVAYFLRRIIKSHKMN